MLKEWRVGEDGGRGFPFTRVRRVLVAVKATEERKKSSRNPGKFHQTWIWVYPVYPQKPRKPPKTKVVRGIQTGYKDTKHFAIEYRDRFHTSLRSREEMAMRMFCRGALRSTFNRFRTTLAVCASACQFSTTSSNMETETPFVSLEADELDKFKSCSTQVPQCVISAKAAA